MRVYEIRGMKPTMAEKLLAHGIGTTDELLEAGRSPKLRSELAGKLGVESTAVLEMVNRADLARVRGIGEVYSNLLENAGVDTVVELSRRVPENLHAKLVEQTQAGDARRAPTLDQVKDWIAQGKALGRLIEY